MEMSKLDICLIFRVGKMINAKLHEEEHVRDMFESDQAIKDYVTEARSLGNQVVRGCRSIKPWL